MVEYIVDCDDSLMLPVCIAGHVHERVIRCKNCKYCTIYKEQAYGPIGYCKCWFVPIYKLSGFCHRAIARE